VTESEYVSVAEAREILGVSKPRMAEILKKGLLAWEPNPVDERGKLIRRTDVEELAAKAGKDTPANAA
jgi:DNA-binding MarR family transcriptional regulator